MPQIIKVLILDSKRPVLTQGAEAWAALAKNLQSEVQAPEVIPSRLMTGVTTRI